VIYGKADVVVPQEKVLTILFNEVLNPFFVYQLFCITLWFNDHSKYYAAILLIYNIVTVFLSAYTRSRPTDSSARQKITHARCSYSGLTAAMSRSKAQS